MPKIKKIKRIQSKTVDTVEVIDREGKLRWFDREVSSHGTVKWLYYCAGETYDLDSDEKDLIKELEDLYKTFKRN